MTPTTSKWYMIASKPTKVYLVFFPIFASCLQCRKNNGIWALFGFCFLRMTAPYMDKTACTYSAPYTQEQVEKVVGSHETLIFIQHRGTTLPMAHCRHVRSGQLSNYTASFTPSHISCLLFITRCEANTCAGC